MNEPSDGASYFSLSLRRICFSISARILDAGTFNASQILISVCTVGDFRSSSRRLM